MARNRTTSSTASMATALATHRATRGPEGAGGVPVLDAPRRLAPRAGAALGRAELERGFDMSYLGRWGASAITLYDV
jgi:hypothetical protein